jgi:trimeric autotransporter adhesin
LALCANTTGANNTAVGQLAMCTNTTGADNVAVGVSALCANTTACWNVAVGEGSMKTTSTGNRNAGLGHNHLSSNTTGSGNTAVGGLNAGTYPVMYANTTGSHNTALGSAALCSNTTGNQNVAIGWSAGADGMINITTETNAYVKVAWTVTSDLRDKTNFGTVPHGLAFVDKLKPVSFKFKKSRENDTPHGTKHYGFLAQDILELEGSDNVIIDDEQPDHLKYKGEHLVPVLVNAIKELKAEIELLKNK